LTCIKLPLYYKILNKNTTLTLRRRTHVAQLVVGHPFDTLKVFFCCPPPSKSNTTSGFVLRPFPSFSSSLLVSSAGPVARQNHSPVFLFGVTGEAADGGRLRALPRTPALPHNHRADGGPACPLQGCGPAAVRLELDRHGTASLDALLPFSPLASPRSWGCHLPCR
jgi:hypothetical protein